MGGRHSRRVERVPARTSTQCGPRPVGITDARTRVEHGAVPSDDLVGEVEELAALLAEVVALARDRAVFPSRWAAIADVAMEHGSVRQAIVAAAAPAGQ